jgi:hypothetical protein
MSALRNILVVTGGRNSGDFLRLLANGGLPVPSLRYASIMIYSYDDPLFDG